MKKQILSLFAFSASLLFLQGCAPSVYAIDSPEPSAYVFIPAESDHATAIDIIGSFHLRRSKTTNFAIKRNLSI